VVFKQALKNSGKTDATFAALQKTLQSIYIQILTAPISI